jgi:hypothetical protein
LLGRGSKKLSEKTRKNRKGDPVLLRPPPVAKPLLLKKLGSSFFL